MTRRHNCCWDRWASPVHTMDFSAPQRVTCRRKQLPARIDDWDGKDGCHIYPLFPALLSSCFSAPPQEITPFPGESSSWPHLSEACSGFVPKCCEGDVLFQKMYGTFWECHLIKNWNWLLEQQLQSPMSPLNVHNYSGHFERGELSKWHMSKAWFSSVQSCNPSDMWLDPQEHR